MSCLMKRLARLKFFIPKPFAQRHGGKTADKYPHVVLESVEDGKSVVRGKFAEKEYAELFRDLLRQMYI